LLEAEVLEPQSLDELNKIISEAETKKKLVVIDLYASWCGPCITFKPQFAKMATDLQEFAVFVKIDGDAQTWASGKLT